MSFQHSSREPHGIRWWWHLGDRSVFRVEFYWWTHFAHASIRTHDSEWTLALALPPLAIWLTLDGFGLWHPQKRCVATWESPQREFWIPDDRECGVSFHDWTLRINPWSLSMEWSSSDPWWVRGLSFNVQDFMLGRTRYRSETLRDGIPLKIPMPEGVYPAVAKIERCTWKRPRWFGRTRTYVSVDVPKGIPFAGKGENSWDCDDDGLFGYSSEGDSLDRAVAKGVESVLSSRRKYGNASAETIAKSLA